MSDSLEPQDDASTPLDEEEKAALIPSYITTRGELNEAEQRNILDAEEWAFKRSRDVLDERFLDTLHKRMLGNVWKWAGKHRRTDKSIGVDAYKIPTELRRMVDDCRYWIEHAATDLFLKSLTQPRFSWGRTNLVDAGDTRQRYVAALHAADKHDFALLMDFVRS